MRRATYGCCIGDWNDLYTGHRWTLPFRNAFARCFGRWQDHSILVQMRATPHARGETPSVEVERSGIDYVARLRYADGRAETKRYRWHRGGLYEAG